MADSENVVEQIPAATIADGTGQTATVADGNGQTAPVENPLDVRMDALTESHKQLQIDVGNNYTSQLAVADRVAKVDTDLELYKSQAADQVKTLSESYDKQIADLKTQLEDLQQDLPKQIADATKDLQSHSGDIETLSKRLNDAGILR